MKDRASAASRKLTADYLLNEIKPFTDKAELHNYRTDGNNVVGLIKATTKTDSYIVIGAHFDSVTDCPGANDNATGTALIYSVAKHIAGLKKRKHHVLVVFFDEEEKGLIGSKAYAQKIKDEDLNVHSVHTVDQLGWDNDGDRGIELEMPTKPLEAHYKSVQKKLGLSFPIHYSKVTSTDHRAFRNLGFKATGITEEYVNKDTTPHYHKPSDTYETVNFEYLGFITTYTQKVFEELLSNNHVPLTPFITPYQRNSGMTSVFSFSRTPVNKQKIVKYCQKQAKYVKSTILTRAISILGCFD